MCDEKIPLRQTQNFEYRGFLVRVSVQENDSGMFLGDVRIMPTVDAPSSEWIWLGDGVQKAYVGPESAMEAWTAESKKKIDELLSGGISKHCMRTEDHDGVKVIAWAVPEGDGSLFSGRAVWGKDPLVGTDTTGVIHTGRHALHDTAQAAVEDAIQQVLQLIRSGVREGA